MNNKTADQGQADDDLRALNGCNDPRIAQWRSKVWGYEACTSSTASKSMEGWGKFLEGKMPKKKINDLLKIECLFVDFQNPYARADEQYTAILIASQQPVALILLDYESEDDDLGGMEFQGIMDVQNFFDYMDSLPNMNKFFRQ